MSLKKRELARIKCRCPGKSLIYSEILGWRGEAPLGRRLCYKGVDERRSNHPASAARRPGLRRQLGRHLGDDALAASAPDPRPSRGALLPRPPGAQGQWRRRGDDAAGKLALARRLRRLAAGDAAGVLPRLRAGGALLA